MKQMTYLIIEFYKHMKVCCNNLEVYKSSINHMAIINYICIATTYQLTSSETHPFFKIRLKNDLSYNL